MCADASPPGLTMMLTPFLSGSSSRDLMRMKSMHSARVASRKSKLGKFNAFCHRGTLELHVGDDDFFEPGLKGVSGGCWFGGISSCIIDKPGGDKNEHASRVVLGAYDNFAIHVVFNGLAVVFGTEIKQRRLTCLHLGPGVCFSFAKGGLLFTVFSFHEAFKLHDTGGHGEFERILICQGWQHIEHDADFLA